jgi:tetratricopeptide (TPR) repeat protein
MPPPPGPPPARIPWLARALLVFGAPVLFLVLLEGTLRLAGYGRPTALFIPDTVPGYDRTNPAFTAPFFPPQFDITPLNFRIARKKPAGHLRVFVLGESAVRGTPEPGFGFAAQLGPQLRAAYPGRVVEVYNLGIVAINSHVVYQAARAAAALEPDLFVLYLGNNEVVGPYGPGSVNLSVMPPLAVVRASIWVAETRAGQLVQALAARWRGRSGPTLEWKGMSTFAGKTVRADDPRLAQVYRNFEANLRDTIAVARGAGAKVVLSTVVANLQDCPPFASLPRAGLPEADRQRGESAYAAGERAWELGRLPDAEGELAEALRADPDFAVAHFVLGKVRAAAGDLAGSRSEFLAALHLDALRFRPDPAINAVVREVAGDTPGVELVDAARELGSDAASTAAPTGRDLLLEHVHFTWEGNRRMARLLGTAAGTALFGPPPGSWLDEPAIADAVGYTVFGHWETLQLMQAIRGQPPFTGQLTFGEDQLRYQHELQQAQAAAHDLAAGQAALHQLVRAAAAAPDDAALQLELAAFMEANRGSPTALPYIDRALTLEPRSADLLVRRSRALVGTGNTAEAERDLEEALRLDPYDLPAYGALAQALRASGHFELGRTVFEAAIRHHPQSGLIRLSYADLLFFHGDRDLAVAQCRAVLDQEPGSADALRRLVSLYTADGKAAEAEALMEGARATQPLNFENDLALARIYDTRGDTAKAAECLADAARGGPATAQVHVYLARNLSRLGRPQDALLELARARRCALLVEDQGLVDQVDETIRKVEGAATR